MGRTVVLSNGHGGVINGIYQTSGKRSSSWHNGILYEGMFNRWVVNRLIEKLDRAKIPYYHISPEYKDTSLETRVNRLKRIYEQNSNIWCLDIHANGGGGKGIEAYTTVGETKADPLAEILLSNLERDLKGVQKMRFDWSDGDRDKEKDFYILRKTKVPTVLLECGFMDQKADYNNLWSEDYLKKVVESVFNSIKQIYNGE